jgi:hypothetical protein
MACSDRKRLAAVDDDGAELEHAHDDDDRPRLHRSYQHHADEHDDHDDHAVPGAALLSRGRQGSSLLRAAVSE